mgnify:CR=1 FL=1
MKDLISAAIVTTAGERTQIHAHRFVRTAEAELPQPEIGSLYLTIAVSSPATEAIDANVLASY